VSLRSKAVFISVLFTAALNQASALSIDVKCGETSVGAINVNASGTGISGAFTSSTGVPPSMGAAAAFCGEDHFNWYQIVTGGTAAAVPKNNAGQQLTFPFVDPPPGGYDPTFDPTWADKLPWYFDEYAPAAGTPNVDMNFFVWKNTFPDHLDFFDFPNNNNNTTFTFKTWLVSLNCCSLKPSFHSFHEGFQWTWTKDNLGNRSVTNIVALAAAPTAAEYANIIGGFQTSVPEPSTFAFMAAAALLVVLRKRA
jgi:hypothetical protein